MDFDMLESIAIELMLPRVFHFNLRKEHYISLEDLFCDYVRELDKVVYTENFNKLKVLISKYRPFFGSRGRKIVDSINESMFPSILDRIKMERYITSDKILIDNLNESGSA